MANWITHSIIADMLLYRMPHLDRRGFAVGSIMPDCNLENADWTAFEPPREVTHYMQGEKKTSAQPEDFYAEHIRGKIFASEEEHSFLLGYYAHLITDVRFMLFIRDQQRLDACFTRLKGEPGLHSVLLGYEESFDTLKQIFGKERIMRDIAYQEQRYIREHPQGCYMTVLRPLASFPDYLPLFPPNAAARKASVMIPQTEPEIPKPAYLFFTPEEYAAYLRDTAAEVHRAILTQA